MKKNFRSIAIFAALALMLAAGVVAQQKSADTAVDPVCGMTVVKAKAAASLDYKGTTYYFCSTGCKETFAKDPEKYLKGAQAPAAQAGQMGQMGQMGRMGGQTGMMPHMQGQASGQPAAACPMMAGAAAGQMGQGMGPAGCPMGRPGVMAGGMGRMGARAGRMAGPGRGPAAFPGLAPLFRLYGNDLEVTVENTKDGAALKFTAKDPEVVKAIQVHLAESLMMMKKMKEAAAAAPAAGVPAKK